MYAITEMSKRIHIDNQHAKEFAEIVAKYDFVDIDLKLVHTNIVRFKLRGHSQPEFIKNLATDRIIPIKCLEVSGGFIRLERLKWYFQSFKVSSVVYDVSNFSIDFSLRCSWQRRHSERQRKVDFCSRSTEIKLLKCPKCLISKTNLQRHAHFLLVKNPIYIKMRCMLTTLVYIISGGASGNRQIRSKKIKRWNSFQPFWLRILDLGIRSGPMS